MSPMSVNVNLETARQALRGLWARQSVISDNIANINTPGYRTKHLDFDAYMAQASNEGATLPTEHIQSDGRKRMRSDQNSVDLEGEMIHLMQNALQYRSLLSQVNRKMDMYHSIVRR